MSGIDDIYHTVGDEEFRIPYTWCLTVRRCECGYALWWDNADSTWHCLNPNCALNKGHVRKKRFSKAKVERILKLKEKFSIREISDRTKLTQRDIYEIITSGGK
jgi:hypothetical protein